MSKAQLAGGLIGLLVVALLGAIAGAIGTGTTAVVVAGGLYLLGFVSMGTAQAVFIWFVAGGAALGAVGWSLWSLVVAAGA